MSKLRIFYPIDESIIQTAAEGNLDRQLSETELKRLPCVFFENDEFYTEIYGAVIAAAEDAMNNENGEWDEWDQEHEGLSLDEILRTWIQ